MTQKENIWGEIRNDFTDDQDITSIDAWLTDDDNENGQVLAKVHPDGKVEYFDERAKEDAYAQEMIIEAVQEKLYSRVVDHIKKDFESYDTTAVIELLESCPNENLIGYLPEEEWEHFKIKL
jgi:hypothetical protein